MCSNTYQSKQQQHARGQVYGLKSGHNHANSAVCHQQGQWVSGAQHVNVFAYITDFLRNHEHTYSEISWGI